MYVCIVLIYANISYVEILRCWLPWTRCKVHMMHVIGLLPKLAAGVPSLRWSQCFSDPGFGDFFMVKTSHLEICKPHRWSSFSYQLLLDFLDHSLASINQSAYIAAHNPAQMKLRQLELYLEIGIFQF